MKFETLTYDAADRIARITLNRPERLNTIVRPMPQEIEAAVERPSLDGEVKVIVLRGAGRAFCAGFDFGGGFHHWDAGITTTHARVQAGRIEPAEHRSRGGRRYAQAPVPRWAREDRAGGVVGVRRARI
jgi:enoyl-CoA hydratase/carnithine racemase